MSRSGPLASPKRTRLRPRVRAPQNVPLVPSLSWGLMTAMTAQLRAFLEAEGLRLEVAVQLSEEWGVTTVRVAGAPIKK